jgi:hypothetical protein
LLAHDDVLKQVWAVTARFVLARQRVVQDIRVAVKAPEYARPSIFTTCFGAVPASRELKPSRRIRIMTPNMVNEL